MNPGAGRKAGRWVNPGAPAFFQYVRNACGMQGLQKPSGKGMRDHMRRWQGWQKPATFIRHQMLMGCRVHRLFWTGHELPGKETALLSGASGFVVRQGSCIRISYLCNKCMWGVRRFYQVLAA